jgi:hypothetical protein
MRTSGRVPHAFVCFTTLSGWSRKLPAGWKPVRVKEAFCIIKISIIQRFPTYGQWDRFLSWINGFPLPISFYQTQHTLFHSANTNKLSHWHSRRIKHMLAPTCEPGSAINILTYEFEDRRTVVRFPADTEVFLFVTQLKLSLGTTQLTLQWMPRNSLPGIKRSNWAN